MSHASKCKYWTPKKRDAKGTRLSSKGTTRHHVYRRGAKPEMKTAGARTLKKLSRDKETGKQDHIKIPKENKSESSTSIIRRVREGEDLER